MIVDSLYYWHWWIIGTILFIIEMMVPTSFFMWIGLGALLTGFISFIMIGIQQPLSLEIQGLLFAILSIVSVFIGKNVLKKNASKATTTTLNRRGAQYVGRVITLTEAMHNGRGHTRIDDTLWSISGPDCPALTQVKITDVDGSLLIVVPVL